MIAFVKQLVCETRFVGGLDATDAHHAREEIQAWWFAIEKRKIAAGLNPNIPGRRGELGEVEIDEANGHPVAPGLIAKQILGIINYIEEQLNKHVYGYELNTKEKQWEDFVEIGIAVHEGLMNAFQHGAWSDPAEHVCVDIELLEEEECQIHLGVTIADPGEGFDPNAVPDARDDEGLQELTGRGNLLMNAFMKVMRNETGNVLRLEKVFNKKTEQSADTEQEAVIQG
jgi:anti-sigma regulatory factor (Ser/Thr protein kinase)